MINGDKDRVVPTASVAELSTKLKTQRGIKIDHEVVPGANHFFENKTEELQTVVGGYLDRRLAQAEEEYETKKAREREREAERQKEREREKSEPPPGALSSGGDDDE
jgi:dienelactone hydrolase